HELVAFSGASHPFGTTCKPQAVSISITHVFPSPRVPYSASILSPSGPITGTDFFWPAVALINTSIVPSPPSPTGSDMVRASGHAFLIPFLIDVVASRAVKLPLNESGAIIIFICHHL